MKKKINVFGLLLFLTSLNLNAQTDELIKPSLCVETRVTNLFQSGYELSLFYNTKKNLSFGLQIAGQNITVNSKELVFNSSDITQLNIRIPWLLAAKTRYHLRKHHEGVYFELSVGAEQFRIKSGSETDNNYNGLILPSVGYIWHPWKRKGFYANPNIGYDFIFANPGEKVINGITYELKSSFPIPAFSLGWKF